MKRNIFAFTLAIALMFVLNSCGKYEEGPSFSLLTKTSRITGLWKIEKQFVNGTEVTLDEFTSNTTFDIMKDGTGKVSAVYGGLTINVNLEWEFSSDKLNLRMRMQDFTTQQYGEWEESKILRLANKELWVAETDTTLGQTTETIIHFAKQ